MKAVVKEEGEEEERREGDASARARAAKKPGFRSRAAPSRARAAIAACARARASRAQSSRRIAIARLPYLETAASVCRHIHPSSGSVEKRSLRSHIRAAPRWSHAARARAEVYNARRFRFVRGAFASGSYT